MTDSSAAQPSLIAQLIATIFTVATPWVVVTIAGRIAGKHAVSASTVRTLRQLRRVTVLIAVPALLGVLAIWPTAWVLPINLGAFAVIGFFGMRALGEIDNASRDWRIVVASERTASLTPRRAGDFLAWSWRSASYAVTIIGLAWFVMRLTSPPGDRLVLIPSVFAFAATMFLMLYEVWIQGVVTGPSVAGDSKVEKQRLVRRVFGVELTLVIVSLAVAHLTLDLDWNVQGALGTTLLLVGGVVGIIGCALALSSGLIQRRYAPDNH